ncbi:hypothetical protein MXB_4771 [Myxobolus squamalis]|nr:hypothetical protein MXB_4771 [Myxobolus squamalis]
MVQHRFLESFFESNCDGKGRFETSLFFKKLVLATPLIEFAKLFFLKSVTCLVNERSIKINNKFTHALIINHMSRRRESNSRIFVGNLPRDIREREIEDIFYKYGKIREVNIRSSKNRGPSFAFVEFDDSRDAEDAIKGRANYDFEGFRIRVEQSNSQGEYRGRSRNSPQQNRRNPPKRSAYRLHVANFPASGSWQDLKDHMRQAGEVLFADVYKDGTAVVEFARHEDMKTALKTLNGRILLKSNCEKTTLGGLEVVVQAVLASLVGSPSPCPNRDPVLGLQFLQAKEAGVGLVQEAVD